MSRKYDYDDESRCFSSAKLQKRSQTVFECKQLPLPGVNEKKTIKCFFFLFLFLTSSQEVLSADRPSTSNMWIVGYFQMCIYFDFLFIAAEVCNQPNTAPWWWCWLSPCVRPPAGCCHLLLVSSVGEVSSRVVTSSWADCCCGIETTHWSYCNEGSAERSAAPGCSLELPTLPDACVDALQLISLSVSFLSFP